MVIRRKSTGKPGERLLVYDNLTSRSGGGTAILPFRARGQSFKPTTGGWKTSQFGLGRLDRAGRLGFRGDGIFYVRYFNDFPYVPMTNVWRDVQSGGLGVESRVYVVQTNARVIERCIQMTTDPGDLVLDPTCGSGTTAYVAEQWGRRWITIDTSRVAVALARSRLMGARYPYYLLADSPEGQRKEAEVARTPPSSAQTHGDLRLGFVYERVPHITLKSIANNAEIDVIWDKWQETSRTCSFQARRYTRQAVGGMGNSARGRPKMARRRENASRPMVEGSDRTSEGGRRLDRRQGRVRISLRQALCR